MNNVVSSKMIIGFFMVMAVLLTGCPKKVMPLGKGAKSPSILPPSVADKDKRLDPNFEGRGVISTLQEEEIPTVSVPPVNKSAEGLVLRPIGQTLGDTANLADIFFDYGQSTVRSIDIPILEKNAKWLLENSARKIELQGHADKRGTNEYNLVLAEKRAHAVQEYLVQLGVDSSKVLVVSFGEERPICTSSEDETCMQTNRRAHFHVE